MWVRRLLCGPVKFSQLQLLINGHTVEIVSFSELLTSPSMCQPTPCLLISMETVPSSSHPLSLNLPAFLCLTLSLSLCVCLSLVLSYIHSPGLGRSRWNKPCLCKSRRMTGLCAQSSDMVAFMLIHTRTQCICGMCMHTLSLETNVTERRVNLFSLKQVSVSYLLPAA